jgi:hypothetical protein
VADRRWRATVEPVQEIETASRRIPGLPVLLHFCFDIQTVGLRPSNGARAVTVYYDPRHPQTALIDSWEDLWLGPLVMIVMGTVFGLAAALPLMWLPLRRAGQGLHHQHTA